MSGAQIDLRDLILKSSPTSCVQNIVRPSGMTAIGTKRTKRAGRLLSVRGGTGQRDQLIAMDEIQIVDVASNQLNERPRETSQFETLQRDLTPVSRRPVEPAAQSGLKGRRDERTLEIITCVDGGVGAERLS
jgi:hypothetical protein